MIAPTIAAAAVAGLGLTDATAAEPDAAALPAPVHAALVCAVAAPGAPAGTEACSYDLKPDVMEGMAA